MDFSKSLADWFATGQLLPHKVCLLARPDLIRIEVAADIAIAIAYYSIPIALLYLVRKRADISFRGVFVLFALFILACGTTHLLDVVTVWQPHHAAQAVMKAVTALLSVGVAAYLWPLMPSLLALPSPSQLKAANDRLEAEIAQREKTLDDLSAEIAARRQAERELRVNRARLAQRVEEQTAELRVAKDAAERANQSKSEFLANMSHELRTPLHGILSFARLGAERTVAPETEKLNRYYTNIETSGKRLLLLLDDLLDLSKLEAGRMRMDFGDENIADLIAMAVDTFSSLAGEHGIVLQSHILTANGSVQCDRHRLLQVLNNLISNAIKFSPSGSVIDIAVHDLMARGQPGVPGGGLILDVRDEGIGIPDAELEAVFDKFIQSSKTQTTSGGTGLGLAICREIVAAHGGSIVALNNPTVGATFRVVLPRQVSERLDVQAAS